MQAAGAELWLTIHFHTELGVRAGRGLVPLVCRAGVNRHGWRCRPLIGRAGRNRQLPANQSPASPVSPYKGMEWWCGWQNESVLPYKGRAALYSPPPPDASRPLDFSAGEHCGERYKLHTNEEGSDSVQPGQLPPSK